MKKILALLLGLATISSSVAYADIAPNPGEKDIPYCSMINNLKDFPNVAFIAAEYGYNDDSMSISQINDQSCLGDKKWAGIQVFAVNKKDIGKYIQEITPITTTSPYVLQSFDPAFKPQDPRKDVNAYPLKDPYAYINGNSPSPFYAYGYTRISTAQADRQQYTHKIFSISQIDNNTRTFIVKEITIKTAEGETAIFSANFTPSDTEIKADKPIFTDVKTDNEYAPSVLFLKRNGYVNGYDDGTYKPEQTINRAEFTKIVMHDSKSDKLYNCDGKFFKDVPAPGTQEEAWYTNYICKAFSEGIIMGYPDNTFRPDQKITFAEAAKIIIKVKELSTEGATDPWYKEFTDYFQKNNITPNTIKSQNKEITRGDMALLIRSVTDPLFYGNDLASDIDPTFYDDPAAISIQDMAFAPTTLTIKKGTTVTWTNGDPFGHDVTSDTGSELVSSIIHAMTTYSHTFNNVGTFNYHCAAHPSMKGSVIVTN
jgi:plastocyanin